MRANAHPHRSSKGITQNPNPNPGSTSPVYSPTQPPPKKRKQTVSEDDGNQTEPATEKPEHVENPCADPPAQDISAVMSMNSMNKNDEQVMTYQDDMYHAATRVKNWLDIIPNARYTKEAEKYFELRAHANWYTTLNSHF